MENAPPTQHGWETRESGEENAVAPTITRNDSYIYSILYLALSFYIYYIMRYDMIYSRFEYNILIYDICSDPYLSSLDFDQLELLILINLVLILIDHLS